MRNAILSMLTDVLRRGPSRRAHRQIFVVALALLCGSASLAQDEGPRELIFRGYQFDPQQFMGVKATEWESLGIDPKFQAAEPEPGVRHWQLMQFVRPFTARDRAALEKQGLALNVYLGGGYVEYQTVETAKRLLEEGLLRAAVPYHPGFKLAPGLLQASLRRAGQESEVIGATEDGAYDMQLRALLFPDADPDSAARELRTLDANRNVYLQDNRRYGGIVYLVFRLDAAADLAHVAALDSIRSIEMVGEIVSDNREAARIGQSGVSTAAPIWDKPLTGQGQVIGIIDEGPPDLEHCFFKDPSVNDNAPGPGHRKVLELRNRANAPGSNLHATNVAGSAAGDDYQASGTHDQRGGAWGARLVLGTYYDFSWEDPQNNNEPWTTWRGELEAASANAFVHSNSWHESGQYSGYSVRAVVVDAFLRSNEDHLVLGSSARTGQDWGAPAIAKNTLAVGAASDDDPMVYGEGLKTPVPSGRRKPDVYAVGCDISSARANTSCGTPERTACRTSYATPHAAALAAIARQYFTEGWYPTGEAQSSDEMRPTGALLKASLVNSARDMTGMPESPASPAYPSQGEGWGIVTLDRTLYFAGDERKLRVWDVRSSYNEALETGDEKSYTVYVEESSLPLIVTLAWFDHAGEPGDGTLRNDLDLVVTAPGGQAVYRGNHFDTALGVSVPGGIADRANNVEQVLIGTPDAGTWMFSIEAADIVFPDFDQGLNGQGYALVVTGAIAESPANSYFVEMTIISFIILLLILAALRLGRWRPKLWRASA